MAVLDKQQYRWECIRRRRAGWFTKASGMGRLAPLLTTAGCFFDKRECEWLAPDERVHTAVQELRHLLDVLAGESPLAPPDRYDDADDDPAEMRPDEDGAIRITGMRLDSPHQLPGYEPWPGPQE